MTAAAAAPCTTSWSRALPPLSRLALPLLCLSVLACGLAACERRIDKGPISGDASKVVMASPGPSSSNPLPGVIPLGDQLPATKSNSPADGTTAVGGMSTKQGSAGGATGGTPAKTGGDGK